jgi:hypothetical protein
MASSLAGATSITPFQPNEASEDGICIGSSLANKFRKLGTCGSESELLVRMLLMSVKLGFSFTVESIQDSSRSRREISISPIVVENGAVIVPLPQSKDCVKGSKIVFESIT